MKLFISSHAHSRQQSKIYAIGRIDPWFLQGDGNGLLQIHPGSGAALSRQLKTSSGLLRDIFLRGIT
jgi:hypothetical protein